MALGPRVYGKKILVSSIDGTLYRIESLLAAETAGGGEMRGNDERHEAFSAFGRSAIWGLGVAALVCASCRRCPFHPKQAPKPSAAQPKQPAKPDPAKPDPAKPDPEKPDPDQPPPEKPLPKFEDMKVPDGRRCCRASRFAGWSRSRMR
ncbi:MAG: hypothetical protein Ct9H300mP1_14170 [Planctomycetaceae bacterium]|nr:MAG: hypothetical protein Ct9H300mP1_14170 [Planctomycetaceae bacterium]